MAFLGLFLNFPAKLLERLAFRDDHRRIAHFLLLGIDFPYAWLR